MVDVVRIAVFAAIVVGLAAVFLLTTANNGYRLPEETQKRVAVTPATTVSKFHRHVIAGFFHTNLAHIGFNLAVFTAGYWLATQRASPFVTAGGAYAIGILCVFLAHLFIVLPLAHTGLPYATRSLHLPLVGFSVIAYATLGAGLHVLPRSAQVGVAAVVLLFEVTAAVFVTAPFVSVYHVVGFAMGFYIRSLVPAAT